MEDERRQSDDSRIKTGQYQRQSRIEEGIEKVRCRGIGLDRRVKDGSMVQQLSLQAFSVLDLSEALVRLWVTAIVKHCIRRMDI